MNEYEMLEALEEKCTEVSDELFTLELKVQELTGIRDRLHSKIQLLTTKVRIEKEINTLLNYKLK